ncbi:MAG: deoxyguanosinetriphosphate triphosphohydrolase [Frankiales bacterium]|nr:deoxyguanosinetriphosphate triphosphohydrolase [Frankiales bacterium]
MAYDEAARERRVDEPDHRTGRTAFQRDRARVLHSGALRRLAGKTQVVEPIGVQAMVPRTRLTHSLECSQVGRELGAALGCDPDLVDTACLAHDLGHPPFGHNGEIALDEAAAACGGFEGNAQSFRLLTRLEVKVEGAGLNLTRGSLDAATKYPWPKGDRRKFGVYDDDLEAFTWVRSGRTDETRPLESQVMDWSDDVAYSVHDFEDGVLGGLIDLDVLRRAAEREAVADLASQHFSEMSAEELEQVWATLLDEPWWPLDFTGSGRDLVALKRTTSTLIGRFCLAAEKATRARFGSTDLFEYAADLVVPAVERAEVALLKAVTLRYVMGRPEASALQAREREVISELVPLVRDRAALEPFYKEQWDAATDEDAKLRVVVDQVAALTDAAAVRLHTRLSG